MTTQNLTIKDLVGIHRSFTDEITIIEIVREMATESYCELLYQQIEDPSQEVEMGTAIECLMCKLDEMCFSTLFSCELELYKDVSSDISWLQSPAAKKLKKSGVSHDELMRIRHVRRSYNILRACLTHIGQMKIEKIAAQKSEPEPESEPESDWGWSDWDDGRDLPEDHPNCFVTVESYYGKDRY